jgi:hypothetical protein
MFITVTTSSTSLRRPNIRPTLKLRPYNPLPTTLHPACIAVYPAPSALSTSVPNSSKTHTTPSHRSMQRRPPRTIRNRHINPTLAQQTHNIRLALNNHAPKAPPRPRHHASSFTPCSSSTRTTCSWPLLAAACNAVRLSRSHASVLEPRCAARRSRRGCCARRGRAWSSSWRGRALRLRRRARGGIVWELGRRHLRRSGALGGLLCDVGSVSEQGLHSRLVVGSDCQY